MSHSLNIEELISKARRRLLDMHFQARAGHIGGNLSCLEAIMALHHLVMTPQDQFVLSKGHSAGALYVTLWSQGKLSDADLDTFCQDDTILPGHPSGVSIPGLLFSTGSLGHGPSLAAGLALASRHKGTGKRVFCFCSDGEWQEGSCWEALIFSVHQRLDNLTILIDQNGWQGFGRTEEVVSCSDLTPRLKSFGASVVSVDGHNVADVLSGLETRESSKPHIVVLNTIKGRGLHYEDRLESHYLPLAEDAYAMACASITADGSK
ncbi:MAG TPA: transketolase [Microvirga sp.]|nr:transketolase [Microvirga sp.]